MGHLRTWLECVTNRRKRRSGAATGVHRRALGFEQYEPRIALAADTPAQSFDVADLSTSALALWSRQWRETPGSDQWAEVAFVPLTTRDSAAWRSQFVDGMLFREAESSTEGGTITVSNGTLLTGSFSIGSPSFADATGADALGGVFRNAYESVKASSSNSTDLLLYADATSADATGGFPWFGGNAPADWGSGDIFLGGESDIGSSAVEPETTAPLTSGASVGGSPILRITAPLAPPDAEGGSIDLTAMVGPTGPLATPETSRLAVAPERRIAERSRAWIEAATTTASEIEGLRARAVVYEVAYSEDRFTELRSANLEPDSSHETSSTPAESTADRLRSGYGDPAGRPAMRPVDMGAIEAVLQDVSAVDETRSSDAEPAENGSARSASPDAARQAVYASLVEEADALESDAGLAITLTRQQRLGLAIAVVVGAAPLIKRGRRAKPTLSEPTAGLH